MLEVSTLLRSGVRVGVASAGWCFSQKDFSSAFGLTVSVTTSPVQEQQGRPLIQRSAAQAACCRQAYRFSLFSRPSCSTSHLKLAKRLMASAC
jgi:hypothetical protein